MINSGIQPLQNLAVLQKLEKYTSSDVKQDWGHFWIDRGFQGNITLCLLTKQISSDEASSRYHGNI